MRLLGLKTIGLCAVWAGLMTGALFARPAGAQPAELEGVGIEERLGAPIPGHLVFRDEQGNSVRLDRFFDGEKPVLLNFVYHECPMLCSMVLEGLTAALKELDWAPGETFEVVTVSFSPVETPELARAQKARYLKQLGNPGAAAGWHFLTGDAAAITALAEAAGFGYRWDEKLQQYAHGAALVFLSPEGTITRYLYGVEYRPFDVRTALLEAGQGKIGTTVDKVLMFCYQYDPASNSFAPHAINLMKLGGLLTLVLLGTFLAVFWRRERRRQREGLVAAGP